MRKVIISMKKIIKKINNKKSIKFKALAIVLALTMAFSIMPIMSMQTVDVQASVGITPADLDAMAIDPQSWMLSADMTHEDFVRHAVVDWEGSQHRHPYTDNFPGTPAQLGVNYHLPTAIPGQQTIQPQNWRGAVLLVEFIDRPMISGMAQGTEIMGNPQVETGVTARSVGARCVANCGNPCTTIGHAAQARSVALKEFWEGFLNSPNFPMNNTYTMNGSWLEYSNGAWTLDMVTYGPFRFPTFEFQHTGIFWNRSSQFGHTVAGVPGPGFDDYMFARQFPAWGLATGAQVGASAIRDQAIAMAHDAYGIHTFIDASGEMVYDFVFLTVAGYCQSPTWQETGSMMFNDRNVIADTPVAIHPNTREPLVNPATGEAFSGYTSQGMQGCSASGTPSRRPGSSYRMHGRTSICCKSTTSGGATPR